MAYHHLAIPWTFRRIIHNQEVYLAMGILNYHYFVGWLYSDGKEDLHLRVYFEDSLVYDYKK